MENTHYFLQLGHCNATKNKLQHETFEYFKSLDGLLIESSELPELKERIKIEIQKLNEKYRRMKSLPVNFDARRFKNQIYVETCEAINFKITAAKLVIIEKLDYFSPTLN
ncbi:hypothetical protein [Flavobacterium facile]|uniref:hypothetical protein n=1 Tax=Flavobacterium facile TaxID=2893174 RepID=UPI002E77D1F3|nr:hypothetical protein [Flavobacterium sp. T-12]